MRFLWYQSALSARMNHISGGWLWYFWRIKMSRKVGINGGLSIEVTDFSTIFTNFCHF
jgi:hypothetical protein